MHIEIDSKSGFCFGVQKAISKAEELMKSGGKISCLGEIVHNHEEVERLSHSGMTTIEKETIDTISHKTVLLRTHGEPPSTYQKLKENNNKIIDATCPVVLKLQQRVHQSFEKLKMNNGQLVIYGKKNHPEVIGLNGQTNNQAIIISTLNDLENIDFTRPIELYCQTTMPLTGFDAIKEAINQQSHNTVTIHDTICRQVSNRVPRMETFSTRHDVILFVSGKNSSNGKFLFEICKKNNPNSFFISTEKEIEKSWFDSAKSVGICGATSTPQWQMELIKDFLENSFSK